MFIVPINPITLLGAVLSLKPIVLKAPKYDDKYYPTTTKCDHG
jgi:hypothetical protein